MQYGKALNIFGKIYKRTLPLMILMFILYAIMGLQDLSASGTTLEIIFQILAGLTVIALLILLPSSILSMLDLAHSTANSHTESLKQILKRQLRPMPILRFYGLIILVFLPVVILGILTAISTIAHITALTVTFAICLAVYYFFMLVFNSFSFSDLAIGSRKTFSAIKTSWQLCCGNYWYTLLSMFLFIIITIVIMWILLIPIGIFSTLLFGEPVPQNTMMHVQHPASITDFIIDIFVYAYAWFFQIPLMNTLMMALYLRAKKKKEG